MRNFKTYFIIFILSILLFVPNSIGSASPDDLTKEITREYSAEIHTTEIDETEKIIIEGNVADDFIQQNPNVKLALFELPTYESEEESISKGIPVSIIDILENFSFEIELQDGERSRLYSKFVVAISNDSGEYTPISNARYITNPEKNAENKYAFPEAKSKKGLQVKGDMTDDAEELGISHAALNLPYNTMLYRDEESSEEDNTLLYTFQGETFYFKKDSVERFDNSIKSLSDNDVLVSLVLLMQSDPSPDTPNEYIIHPDAVGGDGATTFALNTTNEDGVKYVKAITNFVAERYTREDEKYGQVVNYIVGNEVGQNQIWNNMGPKLVTDYVKDYARTLRLIQTVVKSNYENARVYISLDHFWNENIEDDSMWKYDNKKIVDLLTKHVRSEGDIPWNMAFHPYPEDLFNPEFWNDETPIDDFDTPRITFKNLEVLVEYMNQEDFLYNGEMRRIILSEQGLNDRNNSPESQELQAAAYALAYYKTKFLEGIDSFILHRHVDHALEGGLNLGLWTTIEEQIEIANEKKYIYDVFKYIDTEHSLEVTDFAKSIIGINDWADIVDNFDPSQLADRKIPEFLGTDFIKKPLHSKVIDNFEGGVGQWGRADNAISVEQTTTDSNSGNGALQVNFDATAKLWRGAEIKFDEHVNASSKSYLSLALKIPEFDTSKEYTVKVKVYEDSGSAEGIATIDPEEGWTRISLDLADWEGVDSIERIKVWVKSTSTESWSGNFLIDDVELSSKVVAPGNEKNIAIDADYKNNLLEISEGVDVTVTNRSSSKVNGNIKIEPSDIVTFEQKHLKLGNLKSGESKTFTLKVTDLNPLEEGPVSIQLKYRGNIIEKTIGIYKIKTEKTMLFDFEENKQNWYPSDHVTAVNRVDRFLNAPGSPYAGEYALSAEGSEAPASSWKTVAVDLDEPIDLSHATEFFYYINSYGGVPEATYETKLTLFSGTEEITSINETNPDHWNEIRANIEGWEYGENVSKIEISFRAVGNEMVWNPQFQIDSIGFEEIP